MHSTATKINPDNVQNMGDASENVFEVVGGDVAHDCLWELKIHTESE